jgi:hypothetical protein
MKKVYFLLFFSLCSLFLKAQGERIDANKTGIYLNSGQPSIWYKQSNGVWASQFSLMVQGSTADSIVTYANGMLKRTSMSEYGIATGGNATTTGLRVNNLTTTNITTAYPSGLTAGTIVYNSTVGKFNIGDASGSSKTITATEDVSTLICPQGSLTVGASPTTSIVVTITNGVTPNTATTVTRTQLWYQPLGAGTKFLLVPQVDYTITSTVGNDVTFTIGSLPSTTDKFYLIIK